jgi:hypothetical protein
MQVVTVEAEVTAAPELLSFLGSDRVRTFGPTHPLGGGFRVLMSDRGPNGWDEWQALMEVEIVARAVLSHLVDRVERYKLVRDLATERSCHALIFEALVLMQVVEPRVLRAVWRRYEESTSDLVTSEPDLQVECTLLETEALPMMMKKATTPRKRQQRSVDDVPLLLVAGTKVASEAHIAAALDTGLRSSWNDWMGQHTEVSAVLLTAPRLIAREESIRSLDDEHVIVDCNRHTLLWVRNTSARVPLPDGFEKVRER